jgi:hypothetical protein
MEGSRRRAALDTREQLLGVDNRRSAPRELVIKFFEGFLLSGLSKRDQKRAQIPQIA